MNNRKTEGGEGSEIDEGSEVDVDEGEGEGEEPILGGYGDFDNFLKNREYLQGGGDDEEDRDGYDSFTIVESSVNETGGRFISKTPYAAAYKAASKLAKNNSSSKPITFVIKKITKGSNNRHYAYKATINKLPKTIYIFKKYSDSDKKLVTNIHGEVVLVNKYGMIVDFSGSEIWDEKYDPNVKLGSQIALKYDQFKQYVIKPVNKETVIKSIDLPDEYKNIKKTKVKSDKDKEKAKALKDKEKAKALKEKEKAKALKDKEKEKAKALKEKEQIKALKEKEKAKALKDKEKVKALKVKKDCKDGKVRSTFSGRCVKECDEGKIRDPATGKCVKDKIKKLMMKGGYNGSCSTSSCY
jgi:hypothetical protein